TDRAGRVLVEADLTVPGHPEAFVIGDLAALTDAKGQRVPGVAPAAMQMGDYAAATILKRLAGQPVKPFVYRDKGSLAVIGRGAGVAWFRRLRLGGLVAWLAWLVVHIYFLIGFRNRLVVMLKWAWAYLGVYRSARLITIGESPLSEPGPHPMRAESETSTTSVAPPPPPDGPPEAR
ncbi:MAG: NAD(P)/FAD-dependent oxidoreductase, partial [Armatimonadetes bacterium]|nr:NAD(P)/FAD-dependent oxidoreductase [Armatimonadota bacterium]